MKTKIKFLILGFIICMVCVWLGSLIKCEVLTHKYHNEFKDAYKQNSMLGEMEYFKVLNYKSNGSDIAQVYYVSEDNSGADVLTFEYNYDNDSWEEIGWSTVWSATGGSASEVVYPYWWHFIYGGF